MKEKTGQIFSIPHDNPTVAGCTVSKNIYCENGYDINRIIAAINIEVGLTV